MYFDVFTIAATLFNLFILGLAIFSIVIFIKFLRKITRQNKANEEKLDKVLELLKRKNENK